MRVYTAVWYGETENQTVRYQSKMMCEIATAIQERTNHLSVA
jgi:hypothetical protein